MLPPAPVTSTVLPCRVCAMPASSSTTGSRPSRSSGSMSRRRSTRAWPSRSSSALGTVSTGRPVAAASVQRAAALRAAGRRHGHDDMRGGAAHGPVSAQAGQRAQHRHAADARALLGGVVVEQAQHRSSPAGAGRPAACARPRRRPSRARGGSRRCCRRCASARARRACGRRCAPAPGPSARPPGAAPAPRAASSPAPAP